MKRQFVRNTIVERFPQAGRQALATKAFVNPSFPVEENAVGTVNVPGHRKIATRSAQSAASVR
jgi:hypothetical protein